ncbi:MAG: hypothetical protein IPL61_32325 [Myxococcales bacterium]|nr:hypothetical protein [Myxococcales bacterium]
MTRVALVASIALHLLSLWGLRCGARPPRVRTPPSFAIDIAPTPPKAEALAPEQEDLAAVAPPTPTVDPGALVPEPPPPPGIGLADAGVDAELADAAEPIDARRRRRADAGLDAGLDADVDAVPMVADLASDDGDGGVDGGLVALGGDRGVDGGQVALAGDGGADGGAAVASDPADGGAGADGGQVAAAGLDGGTVTAGADGAGDVAARPSAGTAADLRTFFPAGHVVSVLVRLDRLRDTEWAPRVDSVFAPMPDYRSLVGGTGVALTDVFDTLAISTPEPSDAVATTLIVRARATPAALRDLLDADDGPVAWAPVVGGALGRRARAPRVFPGDRRVFLQWKLGWTALAQPGDLGGLLAARAGALDVEAPAAAVPRWLARVPAIEAEAGEPTGPALMVTASGIFPATLPIPYGAGGDLPGPDRVTVTLELDARGFLVRGNVRFADDGAAATAADLIERLRVEILGDRWTALALGQAGALNAIKGLSIQRTGRRLAFATSISVSDARAFLTLVATMVDTYFTTRRPPP